MIQNSTLDVRDAKISQLEKKVRDLEAELTLAYEALTRVKVCTCYIEKKAEEFHA
jgi:hypothetical protein